MYSFLGGLQWVRKKTIDARCSRSGNKWKNLSSTCSSLQVTEDGREKRWKRWRDSKCPCMEISMMESESCFWYILAFFADAWTWVNSLVPWKQRNAPGRVECEMPPMTDCSISNAFKVMTFEKLKAWFGSQNCSIADGARWFDSAKVTKCILPVFYGPYSQSSL